MAEGVEVDRARLIARHVRCRESSHVPLGVDPCVSPGACDALGRTLRAARGTLANQSPADTTYFVYSGLGAVLARERIDGAANWETEEYRVDAFGNVLSSRAGNSNFGGAGDPRFWTYRGGTAAARGLLTRRETGGAPVREGALLTQAADLDGHVVRSQEQLTDVPSLARTLDTPTRQYYSADGAVRAVQRYRALGSGANQGVFEEYRYDALGRRVLVIAQHGTPDAARCARRASRPGATSG